MKGLSIINYRSVADLNRAIVGCLGRIPRDVDLIVGIPRSGTLAANLMALYLNLPLTDLEGFVSGRVMAGGQRQKARLPKPVDFKYVKALVIDDSVNQGNAMREARQRVEQSGIQTKVLYGCVYLKPGADQEVDFFCEICALPRVFEWNMMHDTLLERTCVDIDGVLCRDPSEEENDDGAKYKEFIINVKPTIIPSVRMGCLVTCRLEKYRSLTEQWLHKHGFKYDDLVMMNHPDKKARIAAGNHGQFKAAAYHARNSVLFIESSLGQARTILNMTGKSVFCVESREMLVPGTKSQARRVALKIGPYVWRRIKSTFKVF